jgi:serine protease Do
MALGHPGGYQIDRPPVARFGRILSNTKSVIETDCKLVGGDSGGPLFDMEGNVIGIHSRIGRKLTKNLHVPVQTYRDDWDRLARGDSWGKLLSSVGRPVIGVLGAKDSDEPRIVEVVDASPAQRAGIRPGDLITKFGSQEVKTFQTLKTLVSQRNPGDEVKVEVLRGRETLKFSLVIGALADNG